MRTLRLALLSTLAFACIASGILTHAAEKPRAPKPQAQRPTTTPPPKGVVTLRVVFRPKGKARNRVPTPWDGKLTVTSGKLRAVRPWRADPRDSFDGASWTLAARRAIPRSSRERQRGYDNMPVRDVGMLVELTDARPDTSLRFETKQGNFSFALADVKAGTAKPFLKGLASVSRAATTTRILTAPTEDDFPSAVYAPDGSLYVAYVAFTHGNDFRVRRAFPQMPKDLSNLDQPVGGDQVLLLRLDGGIWTGPLPVTPTGQDVYRTAIAADGKGKAWVFWTARKGGQWDLFARALDGGKFGDTIQLTEDPGPDVFPAATTDKDGRVWVAWQAFRGKSANILARRQDGDSFGQPLTISDTPGNEWTPAIAASADGQVAIAWDTYTKGDYDVYARIWAAGTLGAPVPIAATHKAELRPSIVYDKAGRLWLAFEEAPELWGKDQGALERQGVGLYRGRNIAVRVWAKGRLWRPADQVVHGFMPWMRGRAQRPRWLRLAVPRLAVDAAGTVWLAVRSPQLGERVGVGTSWFEHLVSYRGEQWSRDVACPGTDNILDNRPAIVPAPGGGLHLIASADGRYALTGRMPQWLVRQLRRKGETVTQRPTKARWPDRVNNELVLAQIPAPPAAAVEPKLLPIPTPAPGQPSAWAARETGDVARARAARATVGGKTLRLFRGEFHRHTEISSDGGGDGLLLDMWRYAIDAAAFDWIGNGDHDNGGGREYSWWITQKTTDLFTLSGIFTPMFSYERSNSYPDGHRNVVFARRGIRTLPRLSGGRGKALDELPPDAKRPNSPDTQMLYRYLAQFDGVCASHTSGTNMGTDWRDSDRKVEPIVEIYQGCRQNYEMPGAPRANTAEKSIGGWRPLGFVSRALKMGIRFGFQSSSDHGSTHISYCNVWVEEPTRQAILTAMKRRHIYGATDNIIATMHCGENFMGDAFTTDKKPTLRVRLEGTQPFAKVHVIKDGNHVHTIEPKKQTVEFQWIDLAAKPGATAYYYVRGEQSDGEIVWVSPMWITYEP